MIKLFKIDFKHTTKNMVGILYKDHSNNFVNYVDGLVRHNVKLNDLRLKQICKKWDIGIKDDGKGGYWINGEWDSNLQNKIILLVSLKR
jgi:hypothetical protein